MQQPLNPIDPWNRDVRVALGLRRVVNGAATMTIYGGYAASAEVVAAAASILCRSVVMAELQALASQVIAAATGSEAGCVTGCSAAGIAVAVAGAMTGTDMAKIERLPDTTGMKNRVLIQTGHHCNFGAEVEQMIRITGARVVEIGTATNCAIYHLEEALGPDVAAAVYVISHHTVQSGMIGLKAFCAACHAAGVPVIVDAAAESDLRGPIAAGADLVLYSAHKVLGGVTGGILAGRKDLVRPSFLQERGIGRAMKVGKEGVVGAIVALQTWTARPESDRHAEWRARSEVGLRVLSEVRGIVAALRADPTDRKLVRLRVDVDPARAGITAWRLQRRLASEDPIVTVREHGLDRGFLEVDPRNMTDDEMAYACRRIAALVQEAPASAEDEPPPTFLDARLRSILAWPDLEHVPRFDAASGTFHPATENR